jgi:hypothetical protein
MNRLFRNLITDLSARLPRRENDRRLPTPRPALPAEPTSRDAYRPAPRPAFRPKPPNLTDITSHL